MKKKNHLVSFSLYNAGRHFTAMQCISNTWRLEVQHGRVAPRVKCPTVKFNSSTLIMEVQQTE